MNTENLSKEKKNELEEKEFLAKKKMLGNITFIGELYKNQMLTSRIIRDCIKSLLENSEKPQPEDLESLCKLMISVGPKLDNSKDRSDMNEYFKKITELSKNKSLPPRIIFMLEVYYFFNYYLI